MAIGIAEYVFTAAGQRIYPVAAKINGINYVRVTIDDVPFTDSTQFDIINNSIVFTDEAAPTTGTEVKIYVATSEEFLSNFDVGVANPTNLDVVGEDLALGEESVITIVGNNISYIQDISDNTLDIAAVASNIDEVVIVGTIANNIATVANNTTNINTVATNNNNITTVANNTTNITTVANNNTTITAVANNATNINAVNSNKTNIDTVAGNNSNITTVAGISTKVTTVANNIDDVGNVSDNMSDINDVQNYLDDIATVSGAVGNVNTVATNIAKVNTVSTNISNVNTVANNITNVNTVATNSNNINTVANNNTNINTVASNIGDINSIVDDIANIDTVANNITDINTFADTYFISATAPSSPTKGDLWYDTVNNLMKVYGDNGWANAGSSVNGTSSRNTYTATAGQTTFSSTYDAGYVDVYRNGLKLAPSDFTATNGTTVVLNNACSLNDVVDIVAYGTFELADAYTKNDADVLFAAKQPTLVSGTNIKTIGGVSILGSGDVSISLQAISLPTKVAYNQISVDGTTLTLTSPTSGTDYYFSKTSITTSIQSDTIGGFHYGLTPSGETPTGNKTSADITAIAGINAYSIWTNWHRPNCDPRGMVKVGDIWVDIYLADSRYGIRKYSAPTSITGYKIAGGATNYGREIPIIPSEFGGNGSSNYGKLTWFQVNEIAKASGKRSLRYSEFPSAMYGVLEQTDSSSYDSGGGNIFHIAQLTSKFGIEQATGTQWVWGDDVQGIGGDGWKTGLTDSRGSIYAYTNQPMAVLLGGARATGSNVGSRCSNWSVSVWLSDWDVGCRFACDHLKLV